MTWVKLEGSQPGWEHWAYNANPHDYPDDKQVVLIRTGRALKHDHYDKKYERDKYYALIFYNEDTVCGPYDTLEEAQAIALLL